MDDKNNSAIFRFLDPKNIGLGANISVLSSLLAKISKIICPRGGHFEKWPLQLSQHIFNWGPVLK